MKFTQVVRCIALLFVASACFAQDFVTFDVYPASTFTQPAAINDQGQIVGSSMPSVPNCFGGPPAFCQQGFFRDSDGTISTIGPTPNRPNYFTAAAMAINQLGLAVGSIADASGSDGFLRNTDGTLTPIQYFAPQRENGFGSKTSEPSFPKGLFPPMNTPDAGSAATTINDWGQIAGVIGEGGGRGIGYLREVDGTFITFSATSNTPPAFDTLPQAINDLGEITGYFVDSNGWHGFLREPKGSFVVFDAGLADTFALAINQGGQITGVYTAENVFHGFLRRRGGKITTFDPPGSVNTVATAINIKGQVTGFYFDSNGVAHGFTRSQCGQIETFDVPGVGVSATIAQGINDLGQITGYYTDPTGTHGFLTVRRGGSTKSAFRGGGAKVP